MKRLEAALAGGTLESRVDALRQLCATAPRRRRAGTNLHIHTNESFSVFRSPTEAVWQAVSVSPPTERMNSSAASRWGVRISRNP